MTGRYMVDAYPLENDVPLQVWMCDTCGEEIEGATRGMVAWRDLDQQGYKDFVIFHRYGERESSCDPGDRAGFLSSLNLEDVVGSTGLARLLSWLSLGPLKTYSAEDRCTIADMTGFVDFVRRLQTPYYEEARRRFGDEETAHWLGDANEVLPYLPSTLERIAQGRLGER